MNAFFVKFCIFTVSILVCQVVQGETVRGITENKSETGRVTAADGRIAPIKIEDERNPVGIAPQNWLSQRQKAIVLINGWNPDGVENPLTWSAKWQLLSKNLIGYLNEKDYSKQWSVFHCNWGKAAATGSGFNINLNKYYPPTIAANNSISQGVEYARNLNALCPNLRRVQFVAHSAGSWLAKSAIEELIRINPFVVCQITLLDPYIPDSYQLSTATLSKLIMEGVADNQRVWHAENIYIHDFLTGVETQAILNWGLYNDNFRIDFPGIGSPYNGITSGHSGPILFYADTINALRRIPVMHPDLNSVYDWQNHGASKAFWMNEGLFPKISSESATEVSRVPGEIARLTVGMTFPAGNTFRWWKLEPIPNGRRKVALPTNVVSNQLILDLPVTSGMKNAEYVCEIIGNYKTRTFSSVFKVSGNLDPTPNLVPSVAGVSPLSPSAETQGYQQVTVAGKGFVSSPKVTLLSPSGLSQIVVPNVDSITELSFWYSFVGQPGIWSLVVNNDSGSSSSYSFRVVSSAPSTAPVGLTQIAIDNLPGTIFEGQIVPNVRIHAFYSDGTDRLLDNVTTSNWNVQYSVLSFASPNSFISSQVTSDTLATVTASYSEGGITRSSSSQITVLNNSSSGGVVTGEIVKNGTFENNGFYWTNNNADFHITSDYSFGGHTGGYAWMATSASGQGNNLAGAISQIIDLPSNASGLALSFSCAISVQNPSAATTNDKVTVFLTDEDGYNPINLANINPVTYSNALGQWASFSVDLTPYKGTRKKLVFGGSTDFSNPATLRVDDVRVEITSATPTLVDLAISGAGVIKEGSQSPYKALASFSTGTATDVSTSANWSVNENATISGGTLTAQQVIGQRTARITASYSSGGIMKSVSKDVTILDTAPVPVSLAIYGPSQVDENSGGTFSAVMQLSTGVYQEISSSVYWSFTGTGGQVDPIGRLYTNEVSADTILTVKASYEQDGVTVTAEVPLTILDRLPPNLPSSMTIVGPSSVDEAGTGLFDTEVTYADGSKKFVTAFWQENSRFSTISEHGVLACEEVLSDQVVTLSASFTENAITVNATKNVTIANTQNTIAKPEIIMPAAIEVPVDRQLSLRIQTAHPAVSVMATGLPSGLTLNSTTFEIQGTPVDVGTWEIQLSATNDFGTSTGILLLTVSEDAGPEWIRFTKAAPVTVPADGITSDGEGGCYIYGSNSVAHRNAAGIIDFNSGAMGLTSIASVSGSPNGFAITGRIDGSFTVGGRTISKRMPLSGRGESVLIVFNKSGQALWHDVAYSTDRTVNSAAVVLNSDGSLFWGFNYAAEVSFANIGVGLSLLNPGNPGQLDCAVIKIKPDYTYEWGHRWGGAQDEEVKQIIPSTSYSCRVNIGSYSSSVVRKSILDDGSASSTWNRGGGVPKFNIFEMVSNRFGNPEAQLDSPSYGSQPFDVLVTSPDYTKIWIAGVFKSSALFKRYTTYGGATEDTLLPAATNGSESGFIVKAGNGSIPTKWKTFKSLTANNALTNEVEIKKMAFGSDGSILSAGTYSPSLESDGMRYLNNDQDVSQTSTTKRIFVAGHSAENEMKWALACGGLQGGQVVGLESVGIDKWVMLCDCSGDAKFGRLPVVPGGGMVLVDIELKAPQAEPAETYERWLSSGLSAGDLAAVRSGGATNDLNRNGKSDLLDYAFGSPSVFQPPFSDPICSVVSYPDSKKHFAITFDRALGRSDSKLAVEVSEDLKTWSVGSVYSLGADIPNTPLTSEISRVNMGSFERITVGVNRVATGSLYLRIKATTGQTPSPSPDPLLFEDHFDDNVIDPTKWLIVKNPTSRVAEEGGIMKVETTVTDRPGTIQTLPIQVPVGAKVEMTRRVLLHRDTPFYYNGDNRYFTGWAVFEIGNLAAFRVGYSDYSYSSFDQVATYGFTLSKGGAGASSPPSGGLSTGGLAPLILDQWFDERVVYDSESGVITYFVNNSQIGQMSVGKPTATEGTVPLQLSFQAYGWWTTHYQHFDDLVVRLLP